MRAGGGCLADGGTGVRTNVWGRPLADGGWALAFINAESQSMSVVCGSDCPSVTGWEANQVLRVRDLWAKKDVESTSVMKGISVELEGDGGVAMFKVSPNWKK